MRLTNFQAFKLQVSEFQKFCLIVSRFQQRNNQSNCQRIQGKKKTYIYVCGKNYTVAPEAGLNLFFESSSAGKKNYRVTVGGEMERTWVGWILRWHYHITLRYPDLYRHRQCKKNITAR